MFKFRIAIIGNPNKTDTRYDDSQLSALKKAGFNTVQLNIAWGPRPNDEPLNLEDIISPQREEVLPRVVERFNEIKRRAVACKKYGFRTIFHFGAPNLYQLYLSLRKRKIDEMTEKFSIQKHEIIKKYQYLLTELAARIPEVDDILVYTFDQEAWIGSEFGDDRLARGIPVHERLPQFVTALCGKWAELKPAGIMWWEPWELSAGQIYQMIDKLPTSNFGYMLHSNIAEVQATNPVDTWLRNMAYLAEKKGVPVGVELFLGCTSEELQPLDNIPCPRVVYNQLERVGSLKSVTAVKEYFGLLPDINDPNFKIAGVVFTNPGIEYDKAVQSLADEYGDSKDDIRIAWDTVADGMYLFPWDAAWTLRRFGSRRLYPHGWDGFTLSGRVATSPSWKSTRRAVFMTTETEKLHPWFYEDLALRMDLAADKFESAAVMFEDLSLRVPVKFKADVLLWSRDTGQLGIITRDWQYHMQETLVAYNIRRVLDTGEAVPEEWYQRLRGFLIKDRDNRKKLGAITNEKVEPIDGIISEYDTSPAEWVHKYLNIEFGS